MEKQVIQIIAAHKFVGASSWGYSLFTRQLFPDMQAALSYLEDNVDARRAVQSMVDGRPDAGKYWPDFSAKIEFYLVPLKYAYWIGMIENGKFGKLIHTIVYRTLYEELSDDTNYLR